MSIMSEMAWEIEYRCCDEGMSAVDIAKDLSVPIELVNSWFKEHGIWDEDTPVAETPHEEVYSPYLGA